MYYYRVIVTQDKRRDLVLHSKNKGTRHLYFDLVRRSWDFQYGQMSIDYKEERAPNEYVWTMAPVRGHSEGFSWEETMLWVSMRIKHHKLAKQLWGDMNVKLQAKTVLNVK